jgi:hypothetical protein
MKLDNQELPELLRREIFFQLQVADPGGGIATSTDGALVLYDDDREAESREVAVLVDAYNILNVTNLKPRPRRKAVEVDKRRPGRRQRVKR